MNPQEVFCLNLDCPAREQQGKSNIGVHSTVEQRYICHECGKTFSATQGTLSGALWARLRTDAATVMVVITLLANGCPVQAVVQAFGFDKSLRQRLWISERRYRWVQLTPAMAARLTDHIWTIEELFWFKVPPPTWSPPKRRGRSSKQTLRLIAKWCL